MPNTLIDEVAVNKIRSAGSWRSVSPPSSPTQGSVLPADNPLPARRKIPSNPRPGDIITIPSLDEIPKDSIIRQSRLLNEGAFDHPAIILHKSKDGILSVIMMTSFSCRGAAGYQAATKRGYGNYLPIEEKTRSRNPDAIHCNFRPTKESWAQISEAHKIEASNVRFYGQNDYWVTPASLQKLCGQLASELPREEEQAPVWRQRIPQSIGGACGVQEPMQQQARQNKWQKAECWRVANVAKA